MIEVLAAIINKILDIYEISAMAVVMALVFIGVVITSALEDPEIDKHHLSIKEDL